MDQITFRPEGFETLYKKFKEINERAQKEVKMEFAASAIKIQNDAKRLAPVNFGNLRNSISVSEEGDSKDFVYIVSANVKYAPYVEFGTGPMAERNIPSQYKDYANKFKGKSGGTFKEFMDALMLWVKRKGIGNGNDKSTAFLIARSILKNGLRPHPFLIPSFEQEVPKLTKRIKDILNA